MIQISIIIATYNATKTLKRCLDSIVPQLTDQTELILVDGGSKDNTNEIINSYGNLINVHISEPDKGVYDAWNKGIKAAHGDWIMFIGADDTLCPNAINTYNNFFATNGEDFDIICGKLHFVNDKGTIIRNVGEPWNWDKLRKRKWKLAHPGMLHNKRIFEKIGLFDIQYRICADSDMLQRLGPSTKAGFINDFLVNMSEGGISDSTRAIKEGYIIRKKNKTLPFIENLYGYIILLCKFKLSKLKNKILNHGK